MGGQGGRGPLGKLFYNQPLVWPPPTSLSGLTEGGGRTFQKPTVIRPGRRGRGGDPGGGSVAQVRGACVWGGHTRASGAAGSPVGQCVMQPRHRHSGHQVAVATAGRKTRPCSRATWGPGPGPVLLQLQALGAAERRALDQPPSRSLLPQRQPVNEAAGPCLSPQPG